MGVGVDAVIAAIETILPSADVDAQAPLSARVFKIERTPDGARTAYARLFKGRITVRDQVAYGEGGHDRVTSMSVYQPGGARQTQTASAGQIAALFGLRDVRIGDYVGERAAHVPDRQFPPPTLEAVVAPLERTDKARMRAALQELAAQDPFINVRQDDERDEISVSLYGEVQREVIEATLERDFGVRASFRQVTVLHVERVAGSASEERVIAAPTHTNISGRSSPDSTNPYGATLAATIEPRAPGSGVSVTLDVNVHLVPLYIYNTVAAFESALTEYVRDALHEGPHGWEVTDCAVTFWDSGYFRTGSTARDFRLLTTEIMATLLRRTGTVVCEPYAGIRLELPASSAPGVGALLGQLGARVTGQFSNDETTTMSALLPTRILGEVKRRLPGASSGEGALEEDFAGYQPVVGPAPVRRGR
jgi:ribosomal protection tetracycline resistance protein